MGEGESKLAESPKKTPLDLAVKHFKYFDKACSIQVLKEKCQSDWVLLCPDRVWWPREGTLFPGAIHRLCRFFETSQDKRCLPDDLIYAKGWLRLSENVRHTVKFKLLEWDTRRAIKHMVKTKKSPCKDPAEAMAIKPLAEETSERSNMLFSISPDQTDEQQLEEAWFEENVPQAPCEQRPPSPREKAEKVLKETKQQQQQPPSFPPPIRDKGERDDKTPRLPERSTMPPPTFPSQSVELQFREAGKVLKELKPRLAEGGMGSFLSDTDVQPSSSETCPVTITAEIAPGAPGRQAETMNVQKVYDMTQESGEREAEAEKVEAVRGCRQKQEQEKASKEGLEKVQLEVKMKEEEKEIMEEESKAASQLGQGRQEPRATDQQQKSQTPPPSTFPEEDQKERPEHSISSFGSKPRVQPDLEKAEGILPGSNKECCLLQRESMNLETESQAKKVTEGKRPFAAEAQKDQFNSQSLPTSNQSNRNINTAAKNEVFVVLTEIYQKLQNPQFREILSGFLPLKQNNEIKAESPISPANHDERLIDNPASECNQQPKLPELTTALQGRLSHVKEVADQKKLSAIGTEAKILNPELNPICQKESPGCQAPSSHSKELSNVSKAQSLPDKHSQNTGQELTPACPNQLCCQACIPPQTDGPLCGRSKCPEPLEGIPPKAVLEKNEKNVSNSLICPSQDQSLPERHCQYVDKERPDLPLQWESKCHAEAKPEKETVSLPTAVPQETQGDVSPVQSRENQSVSVSHSCYQPEEQSAPESHDCYQTEDPFAPAPLRNQEGQQANLISKPQIRDLDSVAQKSVLTQVVPVIGRQEVPPEVWAEVDPASLAITAEPIYTPLKDALDWNTPILTAEEPRIRDKCQPVQNLQAIRDMTADANPHVLVGIVIKRGLWYLVLLQPAAEKKFCMFPGMIDHGRIWILDFAALTKPFYGNLKDEIPEQASLTWEPEEKALDSENPRSIAKNLSPVQPRKNSSERSEASSIAAWTRPKEQSPKWEPNSCLEKYEV